MNRIRFAFALAALLLWAPAGSQTAGAQRSSLPSLELAPAQLLSELLKGGYVLYFRHAATDLSQNDERMKTYEDCANQRNLIDRGRSDARAAAAAIRHLGIPVARVLASPFCRTVETAQLLFGRAEKMEEVRGGPSAPAGSERYAALRKILATPVRVGSNLAVVSHGNPFYSVAGPPYLAEGEAAVIRPLGADFQVIARIRIDSWEGLRNAAGAGARGLVRARLRVVFEARVFPEEGQLDRADRAVALLENDDFGHALFRRVRRIDLFAVDREDQVGVLLDRAGLAQVRHDRALRAGALLDRAGKLRERHHGNLELLGERLERARNLGDFGGAVLAFARRLHELEVIDHDQPERAVLPVKATRARAQFERVQRTRFVDEDRRVVELPDGVGQAIPVVIGEATGTKLVLIQPPDGAEHAHRKLAARHFHAEHRHREL